MPITYSNFRVEEVFLSLSFKEELKKKRFKNFNNRGYEFDYNANNLDYKIFLVSRKSAKNVEKQRGV